MANRIQLRRDSYDNWNRINPVLADGEPGLDYDSNKIKIGDGETQWSSLPYATEVIGPTLATVATSGDYTSLTNRPDNPVDFLGDRQVSNHLQFLRYDKFTDLVEFSTDFKVVTSNVVVWPGGTIHQDKVGDVAFARDAVYYCYQEPNAYTVTYSGSTNWVPAGWIKLDTKGPGAPPQVGDKLTDGVYTSTIQSIESGWGVWYADVYMMLINISPAISSWKNGSGSLTVYTGSEPHTVNWAKIGSEVATAPAHNTSNGVAGQTAYDDNYIYRCVQSNLSDIIAGVYATPASVSGNNQSQGTGYVNVLDINMVAAPQIGWTVSDGSNQRTITGVLRQNSAWGYIYTLTLNNTIDWSAPTSLTILSQLAQSGVWKRTALNADTW